MLNDGMRLRGMLWLKLLPSPCALMVLAALGAGPGLFSRRRLHRSMLHSLKRLVNGSPSLSALNYFKGQAAYRLGLRRHQSGATHSYVADSVRYIWTVGQDYLTYGAGDQPDLSGKRILEIGPGDNLGVAIWFIAKGAESVTCVDRFHPQQDKRRNADVYRQLLDSLPDEERARAEQAVRFLPSGECQFDPERIQCRYGHAIEEADRQLGREKFDLILSRAVLEHVYDLRASWRAMVNLLTPDGAMWHKVDLRNHMLFDQFHPLYFLSYREWLWNAIASPDPTLNRQLRPTYDELAAESFESSQVFVTHVIGRDELLPHRTELQLGRDYDEATLAAARSIKPRLAAPYCDMDEMDLIVSGIFVVCQKKRLAPDHEG